MKTLNLGELKVIQNEYAMLIKSYSDTFSSLDFDTFMVNSFIEEVEIFWLKRLDSIRLLLEMLTKDNECFILSGAIYLGCKDNEHFPLKALGDYQFMYDPFIKMEPFFKSNISQIGTQNNIDFFAKVYTDTYKVLTEYETDFIILPLSYLSWNHEKENHIKFLQEVHLNFLSGILGKNISSDEQFRELYRSFEQIENDLNEFYLQNLIFNGIEDERLPIGERINNYIKKNLPPLSNSSEPDKFIFATFTMIGQMTDILLTSSQLNLIPFIRYDVTFRYFLIMNSILKEDDETEVMLNKSILSHIFYENFPTYFFTKIEYNEYIKKLKEYSLIQDVYKRLDLKNKSLQDYKLTEIVDVIRDRFNNRVLNNLSREE
ncbi:hypothetical protein [Bacillus sp. AFS017336]|uniref:hypothetical protein n=1 Tax=Bacillus sp. AFS017336 TaxID=2033489 RepID=UPI000BF11402|nr:hypothetical protein [Bacillus sp. AFS017336]PEL13029.1 hypothetical protein CN601_05950 [Bacillus sp. AFS017336]